MDKQTRLEEMKAVFTSPEMQQALTSVSAIGKDLYHNRGTIIQIHSREDANGRTFHFLAEDIDTFPGTTIRLTIDEDGVLIGEDIIDPLT